MPVSTTNGTAARRRLKAVCPHDCPDTCVVTVDVEGDRAVALGGDPEHRFTQGFLCAKVNRYLERVYSPDRILHPMKRVGPKGEGRFRRISWDAALDEVAARFREVIATHGAMIDLGKAGLDKLELLKGTRLQGSAILEGGDGLMDQFIRDLDVILENLYLHGFEVLG